MSISTDTSTSADTRVAGLDAKLEWLCARIDSLEIGPIRPGRWCWREARPATTETMWQELTAWVDWLNSRYVLDEQIPPCWTRHGAMIEELTALYAGWNAAYIDIDARGFDPLAWHEALARTLSRVREWNRQGCRSDAHREDPAALRPAV
jgi:hypothetical protein